MTDLEHLGSLLSALLDGELPTAEVDEVEGHLAVCADCRQELQATARARDAVRALPMLDPPFGLIERTLLMPKKRIGRMPMVLAGVAAAVGLGFVALAPGRQQTVTPPVSTYVDGHVTATSFSDPVSELASVAVPVSFQSGP